MALDVYFKEDILNTIEALRYAMEALQQRLEQLDQDDPNSGYRFGYFEGFNAALGAFSLAFGLPPSPEDERTPTFHLVDTV